MTALDFELLPFSRIRPTEETCPQRVRQVVAMINQAGAWTRPICIEAGIGALLDGHHRFAAARVLGLTHIPVHVFDYGEVTLSSWRPDIMPTRDEVLARAISGDLYPYKTTRHLFTARLMRPIRMSDLLERCHKMVADADTALGSGLLYQQSGDAGQAQPDRRQG